MHPFWLRLLLTCLLLAPGLSSAICSRTIRVPVAVAGLGVIAGKDAVAGGIYPDILRSIQASGQCSFEIALVPRARLELMFNTGGADLLIPATRAPRRDSSGVFVPLIYSRAMLISLKGDHPPLHSVQGLLDQPSLKVVLVRGFTYGKAYDELVAKLESLGRVWYEPDPLAVARTLATRPDCISIMVPSILVGVIRADGRFTHLLKKLRFEAIDELPWGDAGAYISTSSLSEPDRHALKSLLEEAVQTGLVRKKFLQYYGSDILDQGVRPR
ncbi:hypothetical protein [Pelomonas sp. KK5]|uniref:hypothetical protein n=1 Tax=Pelomonas sp. KK5 TaxID=1855730 RepID=UPI00097BFFB8|nr:hypothetical protein [Pelomonas sp. KK5]